MRARTCFPVLLALVTATFAACGGDDQGDASQPQNEAAAPATDQSQPTQSEQQPAQPAGGAGASADTLFNVDPENVAAALRWDAASKSVTYPLVTGLTTAAGGWNFNGYARGRMTIVVPVGAKVYMPYLNLDAAPHSAGVVTGSADNIPAAPSDPAFPGAVTERFQTGLMANQKSDLRFTADKAGKYLLVCGVPGHPTSGMWVWFEVSSSATEPAIRTS